MLGIEPVTVRKYSHALEKHGYEFEKNKDRRVFKHRDLAVLQQLKYMKEKMGISLDKTAEIVVMKNIDSESDYPTNLRAVQTPELQENGNLQPHDMLYMYSTVSLIAEQNQRILERLDRERLENEYLRQELTALRKQVDEQGQQTFDRLDTFDKRMETVLQEREERQPFWKKLFK